MFVAFGPAKLIGFGVEKPVQGLLHRVYDDLVEVVLDQTFVDGDHVAQWLG